MILTVIGCGNPDANPIVEDHPGAQSQLPQSNPAFLKNLNTRPVPELPEDVLSQVKAFSKATIESSDFETMNASPLTDLTLELQEIENGYVITFPSGSPVPTPTVLRNRLVVSGGFSSQELYCLNIETGGTLWGMELDDDGPSMAVPYEDLLLFGTESCTLFALHQDTGKLAWSAYLGDPLLSGPAIADGKVVTVYPAVVEPPTAVKSLIEQPADPAIIADTSATDQSHSLEDELAQISAAPRQDNQDAATKTRIADLLEPTHVAICMDARTGEVLWLRWIDSDCLSNPVIAKKHVFITSLSGTLYEFSLDDGSVLNAQRGQGTSAPLIEEDQIYLSRRLELPDGSVLEYLATLESDGVRHRYATDPYDAPYLQASVQMNGELQDNAIEFEQMNGFGGGGFGGGGGMFHIPDPLRPDQADSPIEPTEQDPDQNLLGF